MTGGELVYEARKRADLTQRELAEALSTTQSVIARWETGKVSPSFERVVEAIRACGFDLAVRIVAIDDQHALLVQENLRATPLERLQRLYQSGSALERLASKVEKTAQPDSALERLASKVEKTTDEI